MLPKKHYLKSHFTCNYGNVKHILGNTIVTFKKKKGSWLKLMLNYVFLLHPAVTHRQITALVGRRL